MEKLENWKVLKAPACVDSSRRAMYLESCVEDNTLKPRARRVDFKNILLTLVKKGFVVRP